MFFRTRRTVLIQLLAGSTLLGCTSNPEPRITSELMDRRPVCLALEWDQTRPSFFGWTAPDTMVLLPGRGSPPGHGDSGRTEGRVGLAQSQQDREGGGWIWWAQGDTLWISSQSPTMDDLVISVVPDGTRSAGWRGVGMASQEQGRIGLRPYTCSELR